MRIRRVVDLSHTIDNSMQVFPGSPEVRLEQMNCLKDDGFSEKALHITTHVGTHVDVPAHLLAGAQTIERLAPEQFVGRGVCLDVSGCSETVIHRRHLEPHADKIEQTEFLLLATGWDRWWADGRYCRDYPVLSRDAATFLCGFSLKGVGVDTISVDPVNSINLPIHHLLLKKMLIVENLTGLCPLSEQTFLFCCLPLKIAGGDGSPTRAVAMFS